VHPTIRHESSNSSAVTRLSSSAAAEASGSSAGTTLKTSTSRRVRSTTRKAKSATGSPRGRNRDTGRGTGSGSAGTGTGKRAAATASSAGIPAAGALAAPSIALVPQIASIANQPLTPATTRRSRPNSPLRKAAAFEAALTQAAPSAGESAQPGGSSRTALRPAASHRGAGEHSPGDVLKTIGKHISLPVPVPDWSSPIIVALLILALWFGTRAWVAALRARRLEGQRARLLSDLDAMQAALVPEIPTRMGPLEVSVAYRPAEGPAAGGDFYDVFEPRPGQVAVVLGDVAGHGHQALKQAALTHFTLRAYLQAGLEPRAALALAGQVLSDPTGERYATVAVAVYDEPSSTLTYALAGHPPPILLGYPHEPVTVCSSPPIGWGIPTGRRQTTVSLPAGAIACFFSDGLIEARREGQLLGRGQLREILAGLGDGPHAADLLAQVRAAAQGAPDDMVACVVSPTCARSNAHVHVEELEADSRALSRAGVRRFLRECGVPPAEAKRALEQAGQLAAGARTALLRVRFELDRTTVYVAPTGRPTQRGRDQRHAQRAPAVAEPLLQALGAG
jgi:hypothetical protein